MTDSTAALGTAVIGDETITIAQFRGLKAMLAGALVARVMVEVPEINKTVIDFRKDYREKNKMVITRAMAKTPQFGYLGLEDGDFADGPVELPMEPSQQEILMEAFPPIWDLAQQELTRFLALIAIPNSELERADDANGIEDALDAVGKNIIRKGTIDEILELCVIGQDVLRDQIVKKQARLGKLISQVPFLQTWLSMPSQNETQTRTDPPSMSPAGSPISSITSDESTGGADEIPSMESPGTSSSSSSPLTSSDEPQNSELEKNLTKDLQEDAAVGISPLA